MNSRFKRVVLFSFIIITFLFITTSITYKIDAEDEDSAYLLITNPYQVKESSNLIKMNDVDRTKDTLDGKYSDISNEVKNGYDTITNENIIKITEQFDKKINKYFFENTNEENIVYSPISLYYNLLMLLMGSEGEAYDELYELLLGDVTVNNPYDYLSLYLNYLHNYKKGISVINSMWLNNGHNPSQEYADEIAKYLYAEAYKVEFNNSTYNEMSNWINYHSYNLFNYTPNKVKLPGETRIDFYAITDVYLKAKNSETFNKRDNYRGLFNNKYDVEYMHTTYETTTAYQSMHTYQYNDNMYSLKLPLNGFSMQLIMPSDEFLKNHTINELLTNEEQYCSDLKYIEISRYNRNENEYVKDPASRLKIDLTIPKFKLYSSNMLMTPYLQRAGLNKALLKDGEINYYKKMLPGLNSNPWVITSQDCYFQFDNDGVKASSVTRSVGFGCVSAGPTIIDDVLYLKYDEPFIFKITTSGKTIFCGIIYHPEY